MIRKAFLAATLLTLAACSRPMTSSELAFADALFGPELDTSDITVSQGLALAGPIKTVPGNIRLVRATERACVRTPQPRAENVPQAFAFRNRVHLDSTLYASDAALGWPKGLRLPQALIFAHELTHIWQWQNREFTGYSAARAVAESWRLADPYFSRGDEAPDFFSYGFEQQAAIVEDWVCFTVANPTHPRRFVLRALLEPVLPVARFEAAIERPLEDGT